MNRKRTETVVLVHGLGGSRLDMRPIAARLARLGFGVENWGYWSLRSNIEAKARQLAEKLAALNDSESVGKIHLVGHSMGGIIIRAMLAEQSFIAQQNKLGRLVMLAPPNRGSHVASRLAPWVKWLAPSLHELSDDAKSYVNQLPNSPHSAKIEFGVVEATKDRVIRRECVQLDGQTDFASVVGHHGVLPWYSETIQLVESFLLNGRFALLPRYDEPNILTTAVPRRRKAGRRRAATAHGTGGNAKRLAHRH